MFNQNALDTYSQYQEFKDWTNFTEKAKKKGLVPIKIPSRWKDIKELHDNISRQYRDIKAAVDNRDIKYSSRILEALDRVEVGGMVIKIPKETAELSKWGQEMGNCIANKSKPAANGSSIILGIYRDEVLLYNAEISIGSPLKQSLTKEKLLSGEEKDYSIYNIREFKGRKNKAPDTKDRNTVVDYLISKGFAQAENQSNEEERFAEDI